MSTADLIYDEDLAGNFAMFSPCRRYRYALARQVAADEAHALVVVMLNPSTADASADDPTIRRLLGFARRWGFGSLLVGNLFAWRSSCPRELARVDDPVGPDNDDMLFTMIAGALGRVLVAWGGDELAKPRVAPFVELAQRCVASLRAFYPCVELKLSCLGTNADGSPIHPMARGRHRVPDDVEPVPWEIS